MARGQGKKVGEMEVFRSICFRHLEPLRKRPRILPIFMPNAGCPHRCLFCGQEEVTGQPDMGEAPQRAEEDVSQDVQQVLDELPARFEHVSPAAPVEAAFYGGTFTALPGPWPLRFLEALRPLRQRGLVSAVRCSTRPDAVPSHRLAQLAAAGLDTVELGVQTFDNAVLLAARRGHGAEASLGACARARAAGLGLGLQLLPGLPGHTLEAFARDITQCIALRPDFVRIHPCLVLAGTGLETLWRQGGYTPWGLPATVDALGTAVAELWRAGITVARVGLAPEASLLPAILAGPWHPALGSRVRARALWHDIRQRLEGRMAVSLRLPRRYSGEFWGHAGEMEHLYQQLGLIRGGVHFTDGDECVLEVRNG